MEPLQERCAALEPGTELVTPLSNRPFRAGDISTDQLQIRFDDSGETRPLYREQFEVLADRLEDHRLAIADLPPGVEPYATILTLLADFGVEDDEIASFPEPEMGRG